MISSAMPSVGRLKHAAVRQGCPHDAHVHLPDRRIIIHNQDRPLAVVTVCAQPIPLQGTRQRGGAQRLGQMIQRQE